MAESYIDKIPAVIEALIDRAAEDHQPIVLMTCGLAGSGKTTFAKAVLSRYPKFERLSMDEIIFKNHGLYGVDYPASAEIYESYLQEADDIYMREFESLLKNRKDVILEKSFYAKEDREAFNLIIQSSGATRVFVYFNADDKERLWQRICTRSAKTKEANNSLDISRETFDRYWEGFEKPVGEGEIVIDVL